VNLAIAAAILCLAARAEPPPVEVTVSVEKPLVLAYGPGEKEPHLAGTVVATVRNKSEKPIRLRDLAEHGVVFVAETGAPHVVVHSCKCVKDLAEPAAAVYELAPGQARKVTIDDWGCGGGSWPAPPPGRYRLEYRVLLAPAVMPEPAKESPRDQVPKCRKELASEEFWAGAARSVPAAVELKWPGGKKR